MTRIAAAALIFVATGAPAQAEVTARSDQGFAVQHSARVPTDAQRTWRELVRPADWWNGAHSWSGDAANLTLDPRIGGCFCEVLPPAKGERNGRSGGAEHLRVIHVAPGRMLRLSGALGPLQAEAVNGTMTMTLTPAEGDAEGGTVIKFEYVVGGYMRFKTEQIAPAVDRVIGEQLGRLAARLGGSPVAAVPRK